MNDVPEPRGDAVPGEGGGTPTPVDLTGDRAARWMWAMFLAGPVIWFTHFMAVYLVAEAGCTGDGPGLDRLDPPVPITFAVVATALAVPLCAVAAVWAFRHWREAAGRLADGSGPQGSEQSRAGEPSRDRSSLALAGFVLSTFSVAAVLFTAAPLLVLGPC